VWGITAIAVVSKLPGMGIIPLHRKNLSMTVWEKYG